jgi:hypothetical protein
MRSAASLFAALCVMAIPPLPAQQPARWRLVEEWRVGGEVDGPHSFGDVRGMGVLPDGRIVLVDARDQQVHYLGANGQPVRTVGRKGAGPGEFQQANGLVVSPKGDVVVNDASNNRLTLLSSTGDLIRTIPITNPWGFGYVWDAHYNTSGLIDEFVSVRKPGDKASAVARRVWSADFAAIDTIIPPACPNRPPAPAEELRYSFQSARGGMVMSIPYAAPRIGVARTSDGAIWSGQHPGYGKITRVPAGKCEPDVTIELRGARVGVAPELRDSAVAQVTRSAARYGAPSPDLAKIPREYPAFDALFIDSARRLWVERIKSIKVRNFEVYSPGGAFLAEVESPALFRGYRPVVVTNDRVLAFVADEDELLHLVAFRIVRTAR